MKRRILCAAFLCLAAVLPACSDNSAVAGNYNPGEETNVEAPVQINPPEEAVEAPTVEIPAVGAPVVVPPREPEPERVEYIKVTGSNVNIRTGAGKSYAAAGVAERDTLYALAGRSGGWYKTYYKNSPAYICADYCSVVDMDRCSDKVESVAKEGVKLLGVKYVYGATRYHDGGGRLLGGFSPDRFDCSSLMQYIFKIGAGVNLQVNTRTQIYQGRTVARTDIRRGDLLFFTNDSRLNNTGVERVGHVAMYLGDGYILHTASDYAKIERVSAKRWSYFIEAKRMI